jgi:hypothetical protein
MTFLALDIEKQSLIMQRSQLEYEELIISNHLNTVEAELVDYLDASENDSEDSYASSLQAQQELYDGQKSTIESQLKTINSEIDGYDKAIANNIKSECKLSISV